jgi:hypothetical protein
MDSGGLKFPTHGIRFGVSWEGPGGSSRFNPVTWLEEVAEMAEKVLIFGKDT